MSATFTAEGHLYKDEDLVVPSVSQILELAGIRPSLPYPNAQRAGARGAAVHEATEYLDRGDLDVESVAPAIAGYVLAWQRFKQAEEFIPLEIERRGIAGDGLRFGYCIDRRGVMNDGELVLIDLDTSRKPAKHKAIQTAGYADAVRHEGRRASVHLMRDGTYDRERDLIWHDDDHDFEVWRGSLVVGYWRLRHGAVIR